MFRKSLITDNIAIGGRDEAENVSLLLEHGITHVLNTAHQLPNYFPQHFVYLKIGLLGDSLFMIFTVYMSMLLLQNSMYIPT